MSAGERLTEKVGVRVTADEKTELEQAASREDRTPSAIARRGIRRELDRLRKQRGGRS